MPKDTQLVPRAPDAATVAEPPIDRQWVADLVSDWLKTKSPTTLQAYQRDFADFAAFVVTGGASEMVSPSEVPEDTVHEALARLIAGSEGQAHRLALAYKADLMTRVASRTLNRRLSSLRSLIGMARLGWRLDIKGVPVRAVKDTAGVPRTAYKAMRKALTDEIAEARKVTAQALADKGDPAERVYRGLLGSLRDLAILHLWHDMGLRRASVWMLDLGDVNLQRRTLDVQLKGKRDEKFTRPAPRPTCGVLKQYLAVRGTEPGPLFFSLSNRSYRQRLLPTSYNKILTRIVELAEVDHASPHKFRHTAITRALDKGVPIRDVAAFSGHADVRTVMIYDDNRGKVSRQVAELVAADDEDDDDEP